MTCPGKDCGTVFRFATPTKPNAIVTTASCPVCGVERLLEDFKPALVNATIEDVLARGAPAMLRSRSRKQTATPAELLLALPHILKDPPAHQLSRLLAIVFLDWRGPAGDQGWRFIRAILGPENTDTLAFWLGIASSGGTNDAEVLEGLLEGELETVRGAQ